MISRENTLAFKAFFLTPLIFLGIVLMISGCGSGGAGNTGGQTSDNGNPGGGSPTPDLSGGIFKVLVGEEGIYRLTYDALKSAGMNVPGIDPRQLKLVNFYHGAWMEVPIEVSGEEDGRFDAADYVSFYGTGIPRGDRRFEFTKNNVYWLMVESGARKRIAVKTASGDVSAVDQTTFPASIHLEEDSYYLQYRPDPDPADDQKPDHWMWNWTWDNPQDPWKAHTGRVDAYFDLSTYAGGSVTLTFRFQPQTLTEAHHVQIYLYPRLVADETWDTLGSVDTHVVTLHLTKDDGLVAGINSLRILYSSDNILSRFYLDSIDVSYDDTLVYDGGRMVRVFEGLPSDGSQAFRRFVLKTFPTRPAVLDVTDYPVAVYRITALKTGQGYEFRDAPGRRYLATVDTTIPPVSIVRDDSSGLMTASGADYIIIANPDFLADVKPLALYHEGQGLKVLTASITDVYDEFGGGVEDPQAIRDFLRYAYQSYSPRPRYALLVGDTTYDYKDHLGNGAAYGVKNYLPTHFYDFEGLGEVPSDNWFGDVVEDGNGLPEIAMGRIPVKNTYDLKQFVSKTLSYAATGNPGGKAVFVADDDDPRYEELAQALSTQPDFIGLFPDEKTIWLFRSDPEYQDLTHFRTVLMDAMDAGPLLVNYSGHGAVVDWGKEELFRSKGYKAAGTGESIYGVNDLTNKDHYPFVIALDCLNGNFAVPDEGVSYDTEPPVPVSMAEAFLLEKDKGAVAVWAASALGFPSDHEVLGQALFQAIFSEKRYVLGDALLRAMEVSLSGVNCLDDPQDVCTVMFPTDVFSTFVFFGDPAMGLAVASP